VHSPATGAGTGRVQAACATECTPGAKGRCRGNHVLVFICGMHIGATWRIRLNRLCAAAMQLFLKLLPLVMAALWYRAGHYIFALWFLLSFFFFSLPNLSGRRFGSQKIQDAKMMQKIAIWASSHNFVGLYLHN